MPLSLHIQSGRIHEREPSSSRIAVQQLVKISGDPSLVIQDAEIWFKGNANKEAQHQRKVSIQRAAVNCYLRPCIQQSRVSIRCPAKASVDQRRIYCFSNLSLCAFANSSRVTYSHSFCARNGSAESIRMLSSRMKRRPSSAG